MSKARELANLGNAYSDGALSNRNLIINGDMRIDQRNGGASVPLSGGTWTLDRWQCYASPSLKATQQQNVGSVTPPVGFVNYLGYTSISSYTLGATDIFTIRHLIEGYNSAQLNWGTADAKEVTLSFWARSSLTGTFAGALTNDNQDRSYGFTFSISAANTWEYKTVTIAGDITGTWRTDNGRGIDLFISMGMGSTYTAPSNNAWLAGQYYAGTGGTSLVGTNGATFYLTGVQLEVGDTATPFEHRLYGDELARCQRYYNSIHNHYLTYYTSTSCIANVDYAVSMRANPTITIGSNNNGSIVTGGASPSGHYFYLTSAANAYYAGATSDAEL